MDGLFGWIIREGRFCAEIGTPKSSLTLFFYVEEDILSCVRRHGAERLRPAFGAVGMSGILSGARFCTHVVQKIEALLHPGA